MNARKLAITCITGLGLLAFWAWIDLAGYALSVNVITQNDATDLGFACALLFGALVLGTAMILRKAE